MMRSRRWDYNYVQIRVCTRSHGGNDFGPTDYRYLCIRPNYLFYRIEGNYVKVVRVLNEQQDFLQILFGITTAADEWDEDQKMEIKVG